MTCIVALKQGKEIYIGADSLGSNAYTKRVRQDGKVFISGEMIFGFTTSFRMGQILEYEMVAPDRPVNISDMKYLVSYYIPKLIETFNNSNFIGQTNTNDHSSLKKGGNFLMGYMGNIYNIESDFQVALHEDEYDSVGSGSEVALGSLYTSKKSGINDPEKIITLALEAASRFSNGVEGPFKILKI